MPEFSIRSESGSSTVAETPGREPVLARALTCRNLRSVLSVLLGVRPVALLAVIVSLVGFVWPQPSRGSTQGQGAGGSSSVELLMGAKAAVFAWLVLPARAEVPRFASARLERRAAIRAVLAGMGGGETRTVRLAREEGGGWRLVVRVVAGSRSLRLRAAWEGVVVAAAVKASFEERALGSVAWARVLVRNADGSESFVWDGPLQGLPSEATATAERLSSGQMEQLVRDGFARLGVTDGEIVSLEAVRPLGSALLVRVRVADAVGLVWGWETKSTTVWGPIIANDGSVDTDGYYLTVEGLDGKVVYTGAFAARAQMGFTLDTTAGSYDPSGR